MYNKEFWDKVYSEHLFDAPWMSELCAEQNISFIDTIVPDDLSGYRILDYGCGNGEVSYHYYQKGASVVLADISADLVAWLKDKYKETDISIIEVSTPQDCEDEQYDLIIATSLFHHIQPELWNTFLKGFKTLLKPGGLLVISGWDDSDEIIQSENSTARYTGHRAWSITGLRRRIDRIPGWNVLVDRIVEMSLNAFKIKRKFRYYVVKKN